MPHAHIPLFLNPASGQPATTQQVRDLAAGRDDVDLRETQSGDDIERFTREAASSGAKRIIVAGGDGTIHAAVNALMQCDHQPTLGVLPIGSANDFAKSIDLPVDLTEAFNVATSGKLRAVDVVRLNGGDRFMINAATGGFSKLVEKRLSSERKSRWGGLAYAFAAIEALPDTPMYQATLQLDDDELCCEACAIVVSNGRFAGGSQLAPEARIDDHQVDVMLVTAATMAERTALLASFAVDEHLQSKHLLFRQAAKVSVTADPAMPFICDGESIGDDALTFEIVPGAIEVIVPA